MTNSIYKTIKAPKVIKTVFTILILFFASLSTACPDETQSGSPSVNPSGKRRNIFDFNGVRNFVGECYVEKKFQEGISLYDSPDIMDAETVRINNGAYIQILSFEPVNANSDSLPGVRVLVVTNPSIPGRIPTTSDAQIGDILWTFENSLRTDGCDF